MSDHEHGQFNANNIFVKLFILTAIEVGWALIPFPKWLHWGGLLVCAVLKGLLILNYFMHFKFEGWIVKCLVAPTPILVAVVVFALMPDVAKNSRMDHRISEQIDPKTGEIILLGSRDDAHGGGEGHGAAAAGH